MTEGEGHECGVNHFPLGLWAPTLVGDPEDTAPRYVGPCAWGGQDDAPEPC